MAEKATVSGTSALRVITIEATEKPQAIKLRVAAYARVSSSSEDQKHSYGAQLRYYDTLIDRKENWTMVDLYADEGITGTSAEKRKDFRRLLADCRKGKIDRVLTKSVSRFARNAKECLETIRELKQLGISIYFEEQNIDTAAMSGEMLTAVFAAIAQEESQSISANMRWSYQKRMESGSFNTCKAPFGYRLEGGALVVHPQEAEAVRSIFHRFLAGEGCEKIAEYLNTIEVPKRYDGPRWHHGMVRYILRNERYTGNAILQKRYTTDTFPRQKKQNHGVVPQYAVTGSNPPIISQETFDAAQALIERRYKTVTTAKAQGLPLAQKVICGHCGTAFRKKLCHGKQYWTCRTHDTEKEKCPIRQIPQQAIYEAFLRLYYKLKHHPEPLLQMADALQTIRSRRMLWSLDIVALNKRIADLSSQDQMLAQLKQQGLIDPDIFISQQSRLAEQIRAAKQEKAKLLDTEEDTTLRDTQDLLDTLESGPDILDTLDGDLFGELVEKVIVESGERVRFRLKNGLELAENIERTVR